MADFQPTTLIYFARTGVDDNNKVVCHTQGELSNMCSSPEHRVGTMSLSSFQRADGYFLVRVDHKDVPYYQLLQADTILYQNTDTPGAFWIFCNILAVEWKNPDCSFVRFKIDHFMTYQTMIDWEATTAYVEREHVKEDWSAAGNPLFTNMGPAEDFNVNADTPFYHWEKTYNLGMVLIQSPYDTEGKASFEGQETGGLYSSMKTMLAASGAANDFFKKIAEEKDASINNIVGVYGCPLEFNGPIMQGVPGEETETLPAVDKANMTSFPIQYNNAKCWSSPFVNIRLSSSDGSHMDFTPQWMGHDRSTYIVRMKYSGAGQQFGGAVATFDNNAGAFSWQSWRDFMVSLTELPRCPWTADGYTDWSSINQGPQMLKAMSAMSKFMIATAAVAAGVASGGAGLAIAGSIAGANYVAGKAAGAQIDNTFDVGNQLAGIYTTVQTAKATGAAVQGDSSGFNLFDVGIGSWGFKVTYYTVQNYVMRSIDQFFDRFGYRVNQLKKLSLENRPIWTFLKTSECHVIPNPGVPYISEKIINNMFNSGVTMWKYDKYMAGQRIGDFSQAEQNKGTA